MSKKALVLCVAMSSAGLLLSGSATRVAAAAQSSAINMLSARAHARGRLRVIVGHRSPHQRESSLSTDAVVSQRVRHAQAVQAIVANVGAGVVEHVKTLETLPFFGAEVDAAGLASLAASPMG